VTDCLAGSPGWPIDQKRVYITFGGAAYDTTVQKAMSANERFACLDEEWIYDDRWLMETEFYQLNQWLWTYPHAIPQHPKASRGFGWFCWKPFIIMDALSRLEDGDIVLYVDADTYPIANYSRLFEVCHRDGGMMLFHAQGQPGEHWVKRDCMIVMGAGDSLRHKPAGVARFMLFQKGSWRVQQFLSEWLTYCINPYATTFEESEIASEYPELHEHRTEQAIMTILAHKYGLHLYREACEFGNGALADGVEADLYGQLFRQVGDTGAKDDFSGSRFRNMDHSGVGK
jgi:hypothetical protein